MSNAVDTLETKIAEAQASLEQAEAKATDSQTKYQEALAANDLDTARKHKTASEKATADAGMLRDQLQALEGQRDDAVATDSLPEWKKAVTKLDKLAAEEKAVISEVNGLVERIEAMAERVEAANEAATDQWHSTFYLSRQARQEPPQNERGDYHMKQADIRAATDKLRGAIGRQDTRSAYCNIDIMLSREQSA